MRRPGCPKATLGSSSVTPKRTFGPEFTHCTWATGSRCWLQGVEQTLLVLMGCGKKPELGWHRREVTTVEDLIVVLQGSQGQRSLVAA